MYIDLTNGRVHAEVTHPVQIRVLPGEFLEESIDTFLPRRPEKEILTYLPDEVPENDPTMKIRLCAVGKRENDLRKKK